MTHTKRALVVLFTALALGVGLMPTGAQAASGCSGGYSTLFNFANIQCGSGSYAVTTYCKNWLGYVYYAQGPRRSAPQTSTVNCNNGYRPSNVGYVSYS